MTDNLQEQYDELMRELDELAEAYLEAKAGGKDTQQLNIAIGQADRESRKLERKLRKNAV